jgi:hypothetical protein
LGDPADAKLMATTPLCSDWTVGSDAKKMVDLKKVEKVVKRRDDFRENQRVVVLTARNTLDEIPSEVLVYRQVDRVPQAFVLM